MNAVKKPSAKMKINNKYDASFTAGSLLLNEFLAIEPILLDIKVENNLNIEIEKNNFIGIKLHSSRKRVIQEIKRRYNKVDDDFWQFFYNLQPKEKNLALFYLCLKTYPLIFDLHFEVVIKKFKLSGKLREHDITNRLDEIASIDDYVAEWSEVTLKKLNTNYRKALIDAELYDGENLLKQQIFNPFFWSYFSSKGDNWFKEACFLQ